MIFTDDPLFETMMDVTPFGVYVVDVRSYEIVYMNRALINTWGNLMGKTCYRALYGENSPCLFCKNKQLVDERLKPFGNTIVFEHFNEMDDTWYQLQEKGMVWPDGRTVKYSIAVEISELKQVQNQLAEAHAELALKNKQLEAATKAKSMFLASMSHEIRTPMNAIMGLSDLALNADMSPKVRDYLEKISLSANSLLGIINDILDFSKIEAGRMDLEDTPFLLSDVLAQLSGIFHFKTAEKGLEFSISMSDDVPRNLSGDPTRLGQVLINLVSNAVKFTESGKIMTGVSLMNRWEDRVRLSFSVSDTGIGIPGDKLARLFDSFTQVDGSTTRKYGGTGLGLSICKRLVEKMNGGIRVTSREGRGSEFIFEAEFGLAPEPETGRVQLPANLRSLHGPPGNTPPVSLSVTGNMGDASGLVADIRGACLLLVDDNDINRQVAGELLGNAGFRVDEAENGQQAYDAVRKKAYDAVLMDIQMPGMNGYETTKKIRQWEAGRETAPPQRLAIIAMTAHALEGDREKSLAAGLDDHVTKPIDTRQLFTVLASQIRPGRREPLPAPPRRPEPAVFLPGHLPGIDMDAGLQRVAGNAALYRDLLLRFPDKITDLLAQVRSAVEKGETKTAVYAAHSLKGLSGNIGAMALHGALARLEKALTGEDDAGSGSLLPFVETETTKVLEGIKAGVESLPPRAGAPEPKQTVPKPEDLEAARAALQELRRLLLEGDGLAIDQIKTISAMPVFTGSARIAAVEKEIYDLEFEAALDRLGSLEKNGMPPE